LSTPIGIEQARQAALRFLRVPITILDEVKVRDDSGGVESTWVQRSGTVPGWVGSPAARRASGGMADREPEAIAGQFENTTVLVLTLPHYVTITEGARVIVQGLTFQVTALITLRTQTAPTVRVMIREV
jgi:hypothetical protein